MPWSPAPCPTPHPVHKISIIPRGVGALGYVLSRPEEDRYLMTQSELESQIKVALGGTIAEELVYREISNGATSDLEKASHIARRHGQGIRHEPAGPRLLPRAGRAGVSGGIGRRAVRAITASRPPVRSTRKSARSSTTPPRKCVPSCNAADGLGSDRPTADRKGSHRRCRTACFPGAARPGAEAGAGLAMPLRKPVPTERRLSAPSRKRDSRIPLVEQRVISAARGFA